ncbi:MAG: YhdP family protein [Pseudomonadota bacterium]
MERVKRRWWTWAVSLVAATVIAGTVLSGLFQIAVLLAPSYRADLAAWVSEVAGRPVQIGGISLAWRGLAPRFDLSGITLYSEDGSEQLSVERLSLGLGLRRLLLGEWVPTRLELSGLRVSAQIDEQGRIRIAGFDGIEPAQTPRHEQWLGDLERFEHVRLENTELRLLHADFEGSPLILRLDSLDVDRTDAGFAVAADLRLPAERGGRVELAAEIEGPIAQLRRWNGRFEASAADLQPQSWLRPWLLPGTQLAVVELSGRVTGEIGEGHVSRARVELSSGPLVLARAGVLSSAQQSSVVLDYFRNPRGWRMDVSDLSFDGRLLLRGSLRHDVLETESAYDVDADLIDLTQLAPWTGVWRDAPAPVQTLGRGSGRLEALVLRYRSGAGAPRYSLRARLSALGLRADRHFGFAGLSGELSADESGGRLQVSNAAVAVELPSALERPLALESLDADLRWTRSGDGWRLSSEGFGLRFASVEGHGRVQLDLPDAADAQPQLDLSATFSVQNVLDARAYMPQHWPASLKAWLSRAIVAGRMPRAELRISGPLRDFPFHSRPTGEWSLEIDAADVALDYARGWPRLEDIRARLLFSGNGLLVKADRARTEGVAVQSAEVRFDDFDDRTMRVDGVVHGDLARYYAFLRKSPLRGRLRSLLDNTVPRGDARVDLQLQVPLEHAVDTRVLGTVTMDGAELRYGALEPPITAIRGALQFTEREITADALQASFADLPLVLRIESDEGTGGVMRGSFPFAPQADGSGASQFVPAFLRPVLSGRSDWQLELPLADAGGLVLRSDLVGTAVGLPPPLGKAAQTPAPLRVRIGADPQAPLRVDLGYDGRIGVNVVVMREDEGWRVSGVRARLGTSQAPAALSGSFELDGKLDTLELGAWGSVLGDPGGGGLRLDAADVEAGRVVWKNYAMRAARMQYRPVAGGWQMDLSGDGANGRLQWDAAKGGRLSARLQQLRLETLPSPEPAAESGPSQATDPAQLPEVDLICEQLQLGDAALGRAELLAERAPGGLALRTLKLGGGVADLDAGGSWQRVDGESSAQLRFDLTTRGIDKLLVAFGYVPNIEAARSRFTGELAWPASPADLRWEMATGTIELDIESGRLRAVQPGASRILGLINFYALPRRLVLNFDDVVGEGLAFDGIKGSFALAAGTATTEDLRIDGPSLRMDIRGKVGLLARDYDQRVTVYPDVSSGVTLGAVLFGGPAVGALVLLAQELLDKPLDQVTQFSYRIRGPWDNPRIERGEPG